VSAGAWLVLVASIVAGALLIRAVGR